MNKLTICFLVLFLLAAPVAWPALSEAEGQARAAKRSTITVSGTVTGPDGPVPNVWINVNAHPLPFSEATVTNSNGFYSLTIQTDGALNLHAFPELSSRLTQVNLRRVGITGSFTQDFTVTRGYLLSIQLTDSTGRLLENVGFQLMTYRQTTQLPPGHLPEYHLSWDEELHRYQGVLPPDIYSVRVDNPPAGYYPAAALSDLRNTDQIVDLVLSDSPSDPTVYDPPDASKITISLPDGLGETVVSGSPGAVLPVAHVLLTNLNSLHLAHAISNPDGSFAAQIYAPPGSAVMIQHGSHQWQWPGHSNLTSNAQPVMNLYPGTIINVPYDYAAVPGSLSFAAAGAVIYDNTWSQVDPNLGPHVGAAWAMTGTLRPAGRGIVASSSPPDRYAPGESFQIEGLLRLYSHGITTTTDVTAVSVYGGLELLMLYNRDGQPVAPENYGVSASLTASGFPMRSAGRRSMIWLDSGHSFDVSGLCYVGSHIIEGRFSTTGHIPDDLPLGVYRPVIALTFNGVPTSTAWPAPPNDADYRIYRFNEAALPPMVVAGAGSPVSETRRLVWRLLVDDIVQGTRGVGARQDTETIGLSSFIVLQGAPYVAPPTDLRSGRPITYRLEPFLPLITFNVSSVGRAPSPPLIPFALPGGQLKVVMQKPDGTVRDLGSEAFAQSFVRAKTTRAGYGLNPDTMRLDDVYSLKVASNRFRVNFDQYGHHVITLTGEISDVWGDHYVGGGIYDVWVAEPLAIEPGVLPGTPFEVGDIFNPTLQLYPGVPAYVEWVITEYPSSDHSRAIRRIIGGWANRFGYFDSPGITFSAPGEYRVDLTARYVDSRGVMSMGSMTWGGVVMTPQGQAQLIAHGRRGLQNLEHIPGPWFVFCRDLTFIPGATPHTYAPYFNGDIVWSRKESVFECSGEALRVGASMQDTIGLLETRIWQRANRMGTNYELPGSLKERFEHGEIPLFSSTRSGRPPQIVPEDVDQIAYSYFSSQRPGVRVREDITEDNPGPGYWRFDTLYDDQTGVGILGDLPNDYKFQYIGAVYRDLETGHSEYLGQGTGWILLPDDDPLGSRVMPPFAGPGNGGWTTEGGPLMRLRGQDVHIFIQPTGTLPGAVLQVGDTFRFAGHIMPTLDSRVAVTVTAPSGKQRVAGGRANRIGYFYNPAADFAVDEPGLWTVDVRVWHDGRCSGGQTIPPYPSGDVLGSEQGRYWFYVVHRDAPRLNVSAPAPGYLSFRGGVTPVTISGTLPSTLTDAIVDYTITMPGFILKHGQAVVRDGTYTLVFDPVTLHNDFPNLDLVGRDHPDQPGLADTFKIGLLLRGRDAGGSLVYQANSITLQGDQVLIGSASERKLTKAFLPAVLKR